VNCVKHIKVRRLSVVDGGGIEQTYQSTAFEYNRWQVNISQSLSTSELRHVRSAGTQSCALLEIYWMYRRNMPDNTQTYQSTAFEYCRRAATGRAWRAKRCKHIKVRRLNIIWGSATVPQTSCRLANGNRRNSKTRFEVGRENA